MQTIKKFGLIVLIVLGVVALIIFIDFQYKNNKIIKAKAEIVQTMINDSLKQANPCDENVISSDTKKVAYINGKGKIKVRTTATATATTTVEIDGVIYEIKPKSGPTQNYKRQIVSTKPKSGGNKSQGQNTEPFGSGDDYSKSSGNFERTVDEASDVNSGSKVLFSGEIPGNSKVGTAVTADRFRLYYIADKYLRENGMTIPAPRLNGVDGPEFSFDGASNYWFYVDNNTLLSPSMVNSWNYTTIWCVYIGRIGTWDAFLPHESLKGLMKSVRGREDGAISMDELYKMHQVDSDIWTDQNLNGLLMPKNFNPISGEKERGVKRGPEDGLEYQGWDFRSRTTGKVITEKVDGQSSSYNTRN